MLRRSALSHSHLSFLLVISSFLDWTSCDSNITWISPSSGDVFGPGDKLMGRWNATDGSTSPSIRLCMEPPASQLDAPADSSSNCGSIVYPIVQQHSGQYFMTVTVPNVTDDGEFYLQMESDDGETMGSPYFRLSPTASAANNIEPLLDGTQPRNTTAPPSNLAKLMSAHVPPPTAAIAVPLSILGAIMIIAGGAAVHHNRNLTKARELDMAKLRYGGDGDSMSCKSTRSTFVSMATHAGARDYDVGTASHTLPRDHTPFSYRFEAGNFLPELGETRGFPRRATRQPFNTLKSSSYHRDGERDREVFERNQSVADSFRSVRSSSGHVQTASRRSRPGRPLFPEYTSSYWEEGEDDTTVTPSVISDYFLPEKSAATQPRRLPMPPSLLPAPQKLHIRNEVCEFEVPLSPPRLRRKTGEETEKRDVFDAVYRAVNEGR